MSFHVGLDLGSTAIKAVFAIGEKIVWHGKAATAPGQKFLSEQLIAQGLKELAAGPEQIKAIAATGYGKKLFNEANKSIDEISANALGLFKLSGGQARCLVNIGGQDLKVLYLSAAGKVIDFKMNDKCAAGTGRFFELAARLLDAPLSSFGALAAKSQNNLELNSTCVVFAESEIVSLMAEGAAKEDIVQALHLSVAKRVAGLLSRQMPEGELYLDGGPAQNQGLVAALEDELMTEVKVLPSPQFTVAYGAALRLDEN